MPDSSWILRVLVAALCIAFLYGATPTALVWWILWVASWAWRW